MIRIIVLSVFMLLLIWCFLFAYLAILADAAGEYEHKKHFLKLMSFGLMG